MPYRILDHTADVGIEATAPDIPSLFSESVAACAAVILDAEPGEPSGEAFVSVEADDLGALLADLLTEALWMFESTRRLPVSAELEVSSTTAAGRFSTVDVPAVGGPAIKAVTYHQLAVDRTDDGFRARVFFDV